MEIKKYKESKNRSIKIWDLHFGPEKILVKCDVLCGVARPFVPVVLRKRIFENFHTPADPSAGTLSRNIKKKFVWPFMHRDIAGWSKVCLDCQASKVTKHTHALNPIISYFRKHVFGTYTLI